MTKTTLFAGASVALAVLLWAAVGYLGWTVVNIANAQATAQADADTATRTQAASLRLRTTVRDTKAARDALSAIAAVDVVAILDTVEKVGKDAGVKITIGQGLAGSDTPPLHSVSFVVEGEGSFAAVVLAAQLLSSLPIPSAVDQLQFESIDSAASGAAWRVVARLHALTSADISQ